MSEEKCNLGLFRVLLLEVVIGRVGYTEMESRVGLGKVPAQGGDMSNFNDVPQTVIFQKGHFSAKLPSRRVLSLPAVSNCVIFTCLLPTLVSFRTSINHM